MNRVLTITLTEDIDSRLRAVAERTGNTKAKCAREAILKFIEDIEDACIAAERLETPGHRLTMEQAEKALGLNTVEE